MAKSGKAIETTIPVLPAAAKLVRRKVARRDIAAFVARAVQHELERERFAEFIKELKGKIGEPDPADVEEAMKLWQSI